MERQGDKGGLIINIGYITVRYMIKKVSYIVKILILLQFVKCLFF